MLGVLLAILASCLRTRGGARACAPHMARCAHLLEHCFCASACALFLSLIARGSVQIYVSYTQQPSVGGNTQHAEAGPSFRRGAGRVLLLLPLPCRRRFAAPRALVPALALSKALLAGSAAARRRGQVQQPLWRHDLHAAGCQVDNWDHGLDKWEQHLLGGLALNRAGQLDAQQVM
jgi:hypothetical protein